MKTENHLVQVVTVEWDARNPEDVVVARQAIAKYILAGWDLFQAAPELGKTTISRQLEHF
jgi:hypothetical protein